MRKIGEVEVLGQRLAVMEKEAPAYQCGVKYFLMDDEEDEWATITTNIVGLALESGEFPVKTWSENEILREPLLASGLFVDTGKRVSTGFVEAELWRRAG
jgi:hypothetical protein